MVSSWSLVLCTKKASYFLALARVCATANMETSFG
jgi:hypothetical protein